MIFPKGRSLLGGWNILADKMRDLGKCLLSMTYAEMAKPRPRRIGDLFGWSCEKESC